MASYIVMFDTDQDDQFPRGAQAYAAYVDGAIASQPNYPWVVAQFPHAYHLSITLNAALDADALDVERGAASVADVPGWYDRQRARGAARPCIYASAGVMQAGIVPLIRSGRIPRASVRLWSAHYAGEHICGPASCGAVGFDADGTQWTPVAFGRELDQSLLVASFFAAPAPPKPVPVPDPVPAWQEALMNKLPVLQEGAQDRQGEVFYVHRLQALAAVYGQIAGGALPLATDGVFGATTAEAVRAVQHHAGIAADGIVGKDTWSVLITGSAT